MTSTWRATGETSAVQHITREAARQIEQRQQWPYRIATFNYAVPTCTPEGGYREKYRSKN
jgi:hypothetical protein